MDAGIEKECSALGGLFQIIMSDMKASYPAWEDFVSKGAKLQSQLRTTIIVTSSFLDAFQKVADMATSTRGATKEIGSALTRMCMRHRSIETKMKLFTTALMDNLINPLELKIEEWKKVASQLDKDHAKEYKKARADIKKKSSDTIKLQKKVKKGKDEVRGQLDSALQDVNTRYAVLEETEKRAVCRALIEERGRFCSFVNMLKPVLDEEIGMLGEVTHLQTILEDLTHLTAEPHKLPPASEQVILDLKGSDYNYTYQTPPASPSNTLSRKSSISSNYQSNSVRHVPSLDSISSAVDGIHLRPPDSVQEPGGGMNSQPQWGGPENGTAMPPPHNAYSGHGERGRALSTSSTKPQSAREQLALTLGGGGLNSDAPRTSRDSLHCSSGYSTQTTTPSCSEDTIPSHAVKKEPPLYDYDYISLHGGEDGRSPTDFDKSCTVPRNSDLSLQYRKLFQSKRPASTVSLLADPEPLQSAQPPSQHALQQHQQRAGPHVATIRRKPSSKPSFRRGTISGGVPIPISTPQVPLRPSASTVGLGPDDDGTAGPMDGWGGGGGGHPDLTTHSRHSLCQSTQSLNTAAASPYYSLYPGQQPLGNSTEQLYQLNKQQQFALHQQQQRQYQQQQQQHYQQQQQQQHQQHIQQQHQQQQHIQQQHQQQQYQQQQHPQQQHPQHHQYQQQQQQQQMHYQQQQMPLPPGYPHQADHTLLSAKVNAVGLSVESGHGAPALPLPLQQQQVGVGGPESPDEGTSPTEACGGGGDMLTMIRRGVRLRRTITNDRSAPAIAPNHLN
ncbi:protein MTSS 1 isoform X1 [Alosa sapidissima]|uniref:protein MTSS 1 isoform X1 n=1 Tax=Alosa sapidissima TaxID=34773 RepID=UPI001C08B023|nr:protein MTSS 1 isoform X1 [Alosa sapidissima]